MSPAQDQACRALAVAMAQLPPGTARGEFLRQAIMAAAGSLMILEGPRPTAEHLYQMADQIVGGGE